MVLVRPKKKIGSYRPQIRSRHGTHTPLRSKLEFMPFRSMVRLGSSTTIEEAFPARTQEQRSRIVECNKVDAVKRSANKRLMKEAFQKANIKTADWILGTQNWTGDFPVVVKHIYGSRGEGNYLIKSKTELDSFLNSKDRTNYIIEKFYNFSREYRLHVTKNGCFYTCRKMIKDGTPESDKWYRNDSNSVWVIEENPQFDKPVNWDIIVKECVKALNVIGLDVGAIDLKIQSAIDSKGKKRENPDFIILETNSAPSFGNITLQKYLIEIPIILKNKAKEMGLIK